MICLLLFRRIDRYGLEDEIALVDFERAFTGCLDWQDMVAFTAFGLDGLAGVGSLMVLQACIAFAFAALRFSLIDTVAAQIET